MKFAVIFIFSLIAWLSPSHACFASSREASGKVRAGIEDFRHGDFRAAGRAFADAASVAPDDRRIPFDRGCAYLAQQEYDKAVEQFQQSAVAADKKLAAQSCYNLGCTLVAQAKAAFGGKPEESEGENRTEGLKMLRNAANYYRDCLTLAPDHADARYNLETLRLWTRLLQDLWKRRDLEKRRRAMNLLQFLEMLETEQRTLRAKAGELEPEAPSPRKREEVRALESAQRELAEEIEPLKQKIDAALTAPPPANPAIGPSAPAPAPSADTKKALELLQNLADEAHDRMNQATDDLAGQKLLAARSPQARAAEKIDQIFMVLAPYVRLVQKGIQRQEPLVQLSEGASGIQTPRDGNPGEDKNAKSQKFDAADAAWDQKFIADYGRILPAKARRELEQLEKQPSSPLHPEEGKSEGGAKDNTPLLKGEGTENALSAEEQRRELKKALQLGIELAPKVEKLAAEAAELLAQEKPAEALPKQQEALKLLKEMLPKQPPQNQQEQKDQQNKQDQKEKKDQQKKDKQNRDQQKPQDQKDKKDQQKDQKKDQKKDQAKDQQKQNQEQNKNRQPPRTGQADSQQMMTPQQAAAVLRKARARQDEHREMEKILQGYLYRPEKVEKDW